MHQLGAGCGIAPRSLILWGANDGIDWSLNQARLSTLAFLFRRNQSVL